MLMPSFIEWNSTTDGRTAEQTTSKHNACDLMSERDDEICHTRVMTMMVCCGVIVRRLLKLQTHVSLVSNEVCADVF